MSYTNPHADDALDSLAVPAAFGPLGARWERDGRKIASFLVDAMPGVDPALIGAALIIAGAPLGFHAKNLVESHGAPHHVGIPIAVLGFAGNYLYTMAQTEKEPVTAPEPDLAVVRQALEEVDFKLIGFEAAEPSGFDVANLYDAVRHLRTAVAALAGIAPDADDEEAN